MRRKTHSRSNWRSWALLGLIALSCIVVTAGLVFADIPGRTPPRGTVPNPGAQQQELPNITFPAPYNIFEFVVTCMACHGGTIDQSAGHGGNWAGTNMASAARDPVFRANQVIVNNTLKNATGEDGAGNICFRCHSPNGWLSGRFDPTLGGDAVGRDMIQSILLSTDTEGISCEMCHRAIGGVTMQRTDLNPADPVWNMMAGPVGEWPHAGLPYPLGPGDGNPYGDATLQFHDGMSYGGKYGGLVELSFSDVPDFLDPLTGILLGSDYTGQTYGIINPFFTGPILPPPPGMPQTNSLGELLAWNPDGSLSFHFEMGVTPDAMWGSVSPEHLTRENLFVKSPEFCGACHDLTIPVANHGMPEQRTYTEWKYSSHSAAGTRCQDCHMPTMRHEYSDSAPVSLNPDPLVAGWYPNSKDRNPFGGTTFHKMVGANRDLPQMMKVLYPEVDLEVLGAPTGHDPMIFPGMLSDRGPMWDRAHRNTEISLRDAVSVQIVSPPTETATAGVYEVTVRVTNNAGHKVPSGYPDGRRMWIGLQVKNAGGGTVYQSGFYDPATAKLYNDSAMIGLNRALSKAVDATTGNEVMIYERKTGVCDDPTTPTACTMSFSLLNDKILFDNRIPPAGFTGADYSANGTGFWKYDPTTFVPAEDAARYPDGQNWDDVTYRFSAPAGQALTARAEVYHQTLPREFVEHLNNSINALPAADRGPRPEGPPNVLDPNYPLTPTFLSDSITQTTGVDFTTMTDLNGNVLNDHWGGIAYAAWLQTGKGAPFLMGADDTDDTAVPGPPGAPGQPTVVQPIDPNTGLTDPNAQVISWPAVAGADGYLVWIRYGKDTSTPNPADPFDPYPLTASWDKLALVMAPATQVKNVAMNPGKTFQYKVQAFNAKGFGDESPVALAQTPAALPLPPINTRVANVTASTVTLTWMDQADNEIGFFVERQDVLPGQPLGPWVIIAYMGSQTPGGAFGGNIWTDGAALPACPADVVATPPGPAGCTTANRTALQPSSTYNYRVNAYNAAGPSGPDLPVAATTLGPPIAPSGLVGTAVSATQVDLSWTDNSGNEDGFRIQRSTDGVHFAQVGQVAANVTTYSDTTTVAGTTYIYRVVAFNANGVSAPSNTVIVITPAQIIAPSGLAATPSVLSDQPPTVTLNWTDNSTNEGGFAIERALGAGAFTEIARVGANVTTFLDTTVAPKETYNYRVRAFLGTAFSAYSNTATAVTPGEIPEAPSNLRVTRTSNNRIDLAWNDNSPNETNFLLQRATDAGFTLGLTSFTIGANATTFSDRTVARRTTYYYRIQAANADGASAFSASVSATTR